MARSNLNTAAARRSRLAAAAKVAQDASRPGSPGVGARLGAIPRMVGASLAGRYPFLGKGKLALLGLGVGYIVSPIDVVPEALLLLLGTVDDIGVALAIAGALFAETDRFLEWERAFTDPRVVDGSVHR